MRFGTCLLAALALTVCVGSAAEAQIKVKIGVLNDQSGLYADVTGRGSVVAAQMAAEDFNNEKRGVEVEIVFADHQNKADIGSAIARRWIEQEDVDAISDLPTSSVALAVNDIVREKNKILLASGAATSDLTGKACSPNTVHWTFDTWSISNATASAAVESGGNTWFFVAADYAFGAAMQRDTTEAVERAGGKVVGGVRHPINSSDFSSFLLQAQQSKAKVIALASAGADTVNALKQAAEFHIASEGQKLAAGLMVIQNVHALGPNIGQGLLVVEPFYWDLNDGTRAWSQRYFSKMNQMPNSAQAGVYASIMHYLKSIEKATTKEPALVMAAMKATPTSDPLFGNGTIRVDGRHIHDMYLFEVKGALEAKGPWDHYKRLVTIAGAKAFRPLDQGGCYLVGK